MKKVIILNGAIGSGKDEIAKYLVSKYKGKLYLDVNKKQFKDPLIELTKKFYGLSHNEWELLSSRDYKEKPHATLHGMSPRNALIHVSENVIKPVFGKDIFGKLTLQNLSEGINIFSDGGFKEEIIPIIKELGSSEVVVVKLLRSGYNFDGDSRTYLTKDMFQSSERPIMITALNKEGEMESCAEEIFDACVRSIWRL